LSDFGTAAPITSSSTSSCSASEQSDISYISGYSNISAISGLSGISNNADVLHTCKGNIDSEIIGSEYYVAPEMISER
jgi:hypothetical protein